MKRSFKVTRGQRYPYSKPYWIIDELTTDVNCTNGQVYTDNKNNPVCVTIVKDDEIYSEPALISQVMHEGSVLLLEALEHQTNNIWRDELGKVRLEYSHGEVS